eukprot:6764092-Prymnesium_polylepis.1
MAEVSIADVLGPPCPWPTIRFPSSECLPSSRATQSGPPWHVASCRASIVSTHHSKLRPAIALLPRDEIVRLPRRATRNRSGGSPPGRPICQ